MKTTCDLTAVSLRLPHAIHKFSDMKLTLQHPQLICDRRDRHATNPDRFAMPFNWTCVLFLIISQMSTTLCLVWPGPCEYGSEWCWIISFNPDWELWRLTFLSYLINRRQNPIFNSRNGSLIGNVIHIYFHWQVTRVWVMSPSQVITRQPWSSFVHFIWLGKSPHARKIIKSDL